MNIKELRVGNWIHWKSTNSDEQVYRLMEDGFGYPTINRVDCEDADGIPITEEWLIKANAKKRKEGVYLLDSWITLSLEDNDWSDPSFDISINKTYMTAISKVHQLQNLYHALAGGELTIKEQ